jgi:hypothetical protein
MRVGFLFLLACCDLGIGGGGGGGGGGHFAPPPKSFFEIDAESLCQ